MEKIASFTIDHIKLQPGIYVSRKDQIGQEVVTTFDLRMTSPNEEPVMNTAEVHTIEHLGATYLRNKEEIRDKVIYFGPMGCRTGFYLLLAGACRLSAQCDDMIAQVVNPLVVSAIFSLVASTAYGEAWKAVAKSSPANLAKFYLAALVLKLMAGTLVFLIYVLVCDKQNILGFTAIFALFYVVLLVFDCIYFARVEKKNRLS